MSEDKKYIIVCERGVHMHNPFAGNVYDSLSEACDDLRASGQSNNFIYKLAKKVLDYQTFKYRHDITYAVNDDVLSPLYKREIVGITFNPQDNEYTVFFYNYE